VWGAGYAIGRRRRLSTLARSSTILRTGGNQTEIGGMKAPQVQPGLSPLGLFGTPRTHEQKVSHALEKLHRQTEAAGDSDSHPPLLEWFVEEQHEQERTISEVISGLRPLGHDSFRLLRADADLGRWRHSTPSSTFLNSVVVVSDRGTCSSASPCRWKVGTPRLARSVYVPGSGMEKLLA
jgi:hypothetical protein